MAKNLFGNKVRKILRMPIYIDSSFLLSLLLEQKIKEEEIIIWKNHTTRLSSFLLEIECLVALRRIYGDNFESLPKKWLKTKENELKEFINEISVKKIDNSILEIIEFKMELSECRTLDAIHVGTALLFAEHSSEPIYMCSYDKRVRDISSNLNMFLLPESI